MRLVRNLALLVAATLAAGGARAATVTFDLTALGNSGIGSTVTLSDGGTTAVVNGQTVTYSALTITLAAGTVAALDSWGHPRTLRSFTPSGAGLTATSGGLGVSTGGGDAAGIDGSGRNDFITLSSAQTISIVGAGFTELSFNGGGEGRSTLFWAYDTNGTAGINTGDRAATAALSSVTSATFAEASAGSFLLGASGGNSNFRLSSLTLSYTPTVTISPVPLPAGGPLLVLALGGVALLRRRRS